MKLGSETNSMVNHLRSVAVRGQPAPEVGMGATYLHWTDRSPATIVSVEIKHGKNGEVWIVGVQGDRSKLVDGSAMSESQGYEFERNPSAPICYYRGGPDQEWRSVVKGKAGRWKLGGSAAGLRIGERDAYRDPSF